MSSSIKKIIRKLIFESQFSIFFRPDFIASNKLRKTIAEIVSKHQLGLNNSNILDYGCGNKPYRLLFDTEKYVGLDTKNSGHDHLTSSCVDVYYDGNQIPFEKDTFDSVVSFQVLEHVPHFESSFSEITRVTKLNGYILVSVPFIWCEHEQPYDFRRFTSFEIEKISKQFNLKLLEMKKTSNTLEAITQQYATYLMNVTRTRSTIINLLVSLFLISPVTILGTLLARILPGDDSAYLDLVCLFKKEAPI